jgi:hypothetical protein
MKSESSRLRLSRQKQTKKNAALEAAQEVMIRRVMNEMTGDLPPCVSLEQDGETGNFGAFQRQCKSSINDAISA